MTAGIYRLFWKPNTVYVGQSEDLDRRRRDYTSGRIDEQSTRAVDKKLLQSRAFTWEVLEEVPLGQTMLGLQQEFLSQRERHHIADQRLRGYEVLNETLGGRGGGATKPRKGWQRRGADSPSVPSLHELGKGRKLPRRK